MDSEEALASKEVLEEMSVSMFADAEKDFPAKYKFWNCTPDDLKHEDIPELLAEYKRLALLEYNLRMERQKLRAKDAQ